MRALAELTWVELKLLVRDPLTVLFVLVLPVAVLYVLNGVFGGAIPDPSVWEGLPAVDFYTPSYVALVVATVGVLTVPVHLAGYRERGVLRRFRASAISPAMLVGAHVAVAIVVGAAGAALLVVASVLGYDASLPVDWMGVVLSFLLVALAFAALGALLGAVLPTARAAQGLGVLLFFLFMMLGGAGPPIEVLPDAMVSIAEVLPMTFGARLLRSQWLGLGWDAGPTYVLVGILVLASILAVWRYRTD